VRSYEGAGAALALAAALGCSPLATEAPRIRNAVLISIDTLRADHVGSYGYARDTTPHIDEVAREGVLFRHAVSSAPLTLPSHATLLTGTNPPTHGIHDNDAYRLAASHLTLAEALSDAGLATGGIVSALVLDSRFGLDQGFHSYDDDFALGRRDDDISYLERSALEAGKRAVHFVREHANAPFFLFLHFYDPHYEYNPPLRFRLRFPDAPYAGEIAYVDEQLGTLLDELTTLGLKDSTAIIVTSDHGESLGDDEDTHGYFVYQPTQRVPLIVRIPGGVGGREIDDVVGLVDVMPTVLGLLGIQVPAEVEGIDLSAYVIGDARPEHTGGRALYCESFTPTKLGCNPLLAVVGERWKYIHTTRPELYDLREDPEERDNLAAREPGVASELRARLEETLERARTGGDAVPVADDTREQLAFLGYIPFPVDDSLAIDPEKDDPKDLADVFDAIAELLVRMKSQEWGPARVLCRRILERRPEFKDCYRYLGDIALAESRLAEALSHYRLYLALELAGRDAGPPAVGEVLAHVHAGIGSAHARSEDYVQAEASFREAIREDPKGVDYHFNLAHALVLADRRDEAITSLEEVLRLEPKHEPAKRYLAKLRAAPDR
jgi:arylsulfatase A-like enzyme